jgi:Fe/S biogenesis protein NfuA
MDTVLTVTDDALEKILLVRDREDDANQLSLWIEVTGVDAFGKFGYDLWLAPVSDAVEGDAIEAHGGITFTIPRASIEALRGATLDRQGDLASGGLVIQPAHPLGVASEGVAPPAELDGDTAARVSWVLEHHINPAIAAHGGTARLDRVEGTVAYLQLGGACQGCGMVAATLGDGVRAALRDLVPEITEIADVTDHASGTNPYYDPSHA